MPIDTRRGKARSVSSPGVPAHRDVQRLHINARLTVTGLKQDVAGNTRAPGRYVADAAIDAKGTLRKIISSGNSIGEHRPPQRSDGPHPEPPGC